MTSFLWQCSTFSQCACSFIEAWWSCAQMQVFKGVESTVHWTCEALCSCTFWIYSALKVYGWGCCELPWWCHHQRHRQISHQLWLVWPPMAEQIDFLLALSIHPTQLQGQSFMQNNLQAHSNKKSMYGKPFVIIIPWHECKLSCIACQAGACGLIVSHAVFHKCITHYEERSTYEEIATNPHNSCLLSRVVTFVFVQCLIDGHGIERKLTSADIAVSEGNWRHKTVWLNSCLVGHERHWGQAR